LQTVRVMVFNATFHNFQLYCGGVLLVEETEVPRENHWTAASHWQTLSHNVISSTPHHEQDLITTLMVIGTDCTDSCKSNYHTTTTTTTLYILWKKIY